MSGPAPILDIRNLFACYGNITIVRDLSLQVKSGEIVVLIGSNGAGKTTVLKTICGLLHPLSGSVLYQGRDISRSGPEDIVKMGISLVPERRRLFGPMTVMDNLLLGTYSLDNHRRRIETPQSLAECVEVFPVLNERRRQRADTLSGGEQQMLAVARGLMSRPRLLLLDEPTLGLAPLLVKSIMEAIANLRRKGMTILLVEQNARAALKVADRAYVIEKGQLLLQGAAAEICNDPMIGQAYLGKEC